MRRGRQRLFCYGTLMFPRVMARVAGRRFPARPARLPGFAVYRLWGEPYPGLRPRPGAAAEGVLYEGLDTVHLQRLDRYEGRLYCRRRVLLADGRPAWTYVISARGRRRLAPAPWDGARFAHASLRAYSARLRVPWARRSPGGVTGRIRCCRGRGALPRRCS